MAERATDAGIFALCLPGAKRNGRQEPPWFAIAPCRLYGFGPQDAAVVLAIHGRIDERVPLTLRGDWLVCSDPLTGRTMWEGEKGDSETQFVQQVEYKFIPDMETKYKACLYDLMRVQRQRFGPAPHPKNLQIRLSLL